MSYYLKQPKLTDNMKIADILILYFLSCDLFICIMVACIKHLNLFATTIIPIMSPSYLEIDLFF